MVTHTLPPRVLPATLTRKPIGVALQGGGSWGAFTWGVLDALLASRRVTIAQLSGTSAGAINAAIVAGALASGSTRRAPRRAREALQAFWLHIADPAMADIARALWGPLGRSWRDAMGHAVGDWVASGALPAPSALNINPLRQALEAHVDIDAIRSKTAPALFVTVTHVKTGLPRVISNDAMSIEALLASACLPELFQAVELDGEHYWDGGYSGNPTLWPMIHSGASDDLIVVQLVPDLSGDIPTSAPSIRRRVGEIIFNSSLVAEMQAIAGMRALAARGQVGRSVVDLRLHRIGPPRQALFAKGTASERSRAWLQLLHDEGRDAGRDFMIRHGADVGVRETLDVGRVFANAHKPKLRLPPIDSPPSPPDDPALVIPAALLDA